MGAEATYEPHTALVRMAITANGQSEPRLTLVGRWGVFEIFTTEGEYMTKESHDNRKVNTPTAAQPINSTKSLVCIQLTSTIRVKKLCNSVREPA